MPWNPALNPLRGALAERYPTEVRARRITAAVALDDCPAAPPSPKGP